MTTAKVKGHCWGDKVEQQENRREDQSFPWPCILPLSSSRSRAAGAEATREHLAEWIGPPRRVGRGWEVRAERPTQADARSSHSMSLNTKGTLAHDNNKRQSQWIKDIKLHSHPPHYGFLKFWSDFTVKTWVIWRVPTSSPSKLLICLFSSSSPCKLV